MTSNLDVTAHYQKYFYTVKATTSELQKLAYRLRYQVYYEEQKMISSKHVINRIETDIWDPHSIHCLQFHKPSSLPIGNVRLIPLDGSSTHSLPIEEHYTKTFNFQNMPINDLREGKTGEISRMAIVSSFRRRACDQTYAFETDINRERESDKRFSLNYMPMCLAFTAIILMMEANLDYGAALMEPRLARLLARFGIDLKQIGEPMEYFGVRAPYLIFPDTTYQSLPASYKDLFDFIRQELRSS